MSQQQQDLIILTVLDLYIMYLPATVSKYPEHQGPNQKVERKYLEKILGVAIWCFSIRITEIMSTTAVSIWVMADSYTQAQAESMGSLYLI